MSGQDFIMTGRLLLAPLSGISDSPFRRVCKSFGAEGMYTEMISSEGLTRKNAKSAELADFTEGERPIGMQIFGRRPESMAEAARMLEERRPDLIDINACCPARRIVSKGGGAALLKTPDLLGRIVEAVVRATTLPVTVKTRIGWDDETINAVESARVAEAAGAAAVCVHGRTARQVFRGRSDWSRVAEVKDSVGIPVILTGDIISPEDALRGLQETGCDAVMVGRGSFGRPWIFRQIHELREHGSYAEFPHEEMVAVALRHLDLMIERFGETMGVLMFRKHLLWYTKGLYGVVALRPQMTQLHSKAEVAALLGRIVSDGVRRSVRGAERD